MSNTKLRQICRVFIAILCIVLAFTFFVSCSRSGVTLSDSRHNQPPSNSAPPGDILPDDVLSADPNAPLVPGNNSSRPYYILNTRSRVVHTNDCGAARNISSANRAIEHNLYAAISRGFTPCRTCLGDAEITPPADFVPPENDASNEDDTFDDNGFDENETSTDSPNIPPQNPQHAYYIKNTNSRVIHTNLCGAARNISQANRATTTDFMGALSDGFRVCLTCLSDRSHIVPPASNQPPANPPAQPPSQGNSSQSPANPPAQPPSQGNSSQPQNPQHSYYIKNTNSRVIHTNLCGAARNISQANRATTDDFMGALSDGFRVCLTCLSDRAHIVPPVSNHPPADTQNQSPAQHSYYIKNTNSRVIHTNLCGVVNNISQTNRATTDDFMGALSDGFRVCLTCLSDRAHIVPPALQTPTQPNTSENYYIIHNPTGRIHRPSCSFAMHIHQSNRGIVNDLSSAIANGSMLCHHCFEGHPDLPQEDDCCSILFIINTNSMVIHVHTCGAARNISDRNRGYTLYFDDAILLGFRTCNTCIRN